MQTAETGPVALQDEVDSLHDFFELAAWESAFEFFGVGSAVALGQTAGVAATINRNDDVAG